MSKAWRWVVGIAVVGLVGIASYLLLCRPVGEMLGLVAGGGVEMLREPMRPAGAGSRVLIFALDGVGDDELLEAIASGHAPNLATLLGGPLDDRTFDRGYAVPGVLSILPSTTMAAWASLFTGVTAAFTGIPGNEWFVREEMQFYAPAPVSVEGTRHALEAYTDDLMGGALRAPTVFERADVRAYVALSQFHRGADLLVVPSASALADLVTAAIAGLTDDDSMEQEAYADLDLNAVDNLIDAVAEHGVADLQVVYFPGVDLYTHIADPPLESQRSYITDVIDVAIGRLLDVYRQAGVLDSTWVLFVSDHGHTPVLDDDRHALGAEDSSGLVTLLERAGFRVRARKLDLDDDEQDFQATFAFQGAFAYVYLADRSSCPAAGSVCDWSRPPRLEEDVRPVLQALHAANNGGAGSASLQGTLDLIFSRSPRRYDEDADPFSVWDGRGLVPVGEHLAAAPRPDLLDLQRRLEGLGAGPYGHRSGDILLLARSGAVRPIEDRYYFSARYRSWHGSPDAQDSRIPLLIAHGTTDGPAIRGIVQQVAGEQLHQEDITGLILALLRR